MCLEESFLTYNAVSSLRHVSQADSAFPLFYAANNECLLTVELLLSYGADVNTSDKVSHPCLVTAAPMTSSTICVFCVGSSQYRYCYILCM